MKFKKLNFKIIFLKKYLLIVNISIILFKFIIKP